MSRLVVLALVALVAGTSDAGPRRTFPSLTVFGGCYFEHECGAGPDGTGYGPVGKHYVCNQYAFTPDGKFIERRGEKHSTSGRYQRAGRRITLTPIDERGRRGRTRTLTLSADGNELDGLRRRGS